METDRGLAPQAIVLASTVQHRGITSRPVRGSSNPTRLSLHQSNAIDSPLRPIDARHQTLPSFHAASRRNARTQREEPAQARPRKFSVFPCEAVSAARRQSHWRLILGPWQQSQGEQVDPKKPRRSQRLQSPSHAADTHFKVGQLPSPVTHKDSNATDEFKEGTITPPSQRPSDNSDPSNPTRSPKGAAGLSSPPSDTQPFSQFIYPPQNRPYAVEDEEGEGVWGYLVPLDDHSGETLVLRRRMACPVSSDKVGKTSGKDSVPQKKYEKQEEEYETEKTEKGVTAGGYLIGRHPECGKISAPIAATLN